MDGQSVVERTQGLVRLLELLADREALGTVLLAFSALDTLGGKGRFLCESDGLGELEAPQAFGFCEHGVVAAEDSRNVDAFGTGHAVAAACAADFFPFADDSLTLSRTSKSSSVRWPGSASEAVLQFSSTICREFMPDSTTVTSGWL